jgi:23S rRNA (pseudouridine1915-N3)-methyltransferase
MKLTILALGTRMPDWVERGVLEYSKRLPPEIGLDWRELPLATRGKSGNSQALVREAETIRKALPPQDRLVILDVLGRSFSTEKLATKLADWQMSAMNYSIVIGGPDGVEQSLLREADLLWSLSPLTLPHPLVRVVLAEQLYRAWSINAGHPYHRS